MEGRLDLAVNKSCDGVDPSNVEVCTQRGVTKVMEKIMSTFVPGERAFRIDGLQRNAVKAFWLALSCVVH